MKIAPKKKSGIRSSNRATDKHPRITFKLPHAGNDHLIPLKENSSCLKDTYELDLHKKNKRKQNNELRAHLFDETNENSLDDDHEGEIGFSRNGIQNNIHRRKANSFKKDKFDESLIDNSLIPIESPFGTIQGQIIKSEFNLWSLYCVLSLLTCGLFTLIDLFTRNRLSNWLIFRRANSIDEASHIRFKIKDNTTKENTHFSKQNSTSFYRKITKVKSDCEEGLSSETYVFEYNLILFYFNIESKSFQDFHCFRKSYLQKKLDMNNFEGLTQEAAHSVKSVYDSHARTFGFSSLLSKIISQIFTILSIFEFIAVIFLYYHNFIEFALCLLVTLITYCSINIVHELNFENELRKKLSFNEKIIVKRISNTGVSEKHIVDSDKLVSGDIIEITNNLLLPADVILLNGSCFIQGNCSNSIVQKFPRDIFRKDFNQDSFFSIEAGSKVVSATDQLNQDCFGMVLNAGFDIHPMKYIKQNTNFKENIKNSWRSAMCIGLVSLSFLACGLFLYRQKIILKNKSISTQSIFSNLVEIFLVLANPIIPLLFGFVIRQSYHRLRKIGVTIGSTTQIRQAGRIRNSLIEGNAIPISAKKTDCIILNKFTNFNENECTAFDEYRYSKEDLFLSAETNKNAKRMIEAFSVCNLGSKIGTDYTGIDSEIEMMRDSPLEHIPMPEHSNYLINIEASKPFQQVFKCQYHLHRILSHQPKLMSVIIATSRGEYFIYSRLDSSLIEKKCRKSSIPLDCYSFINNLMHRSGEIYAFACRQIQKEEINLPVDEIEIDLALLGLYCLSPIISEKNIESMTSLCKEKINFIALSSFSTSSLIITAKKSGMISPDNSILLGKIEDSEKSKRIVWTLSEPTLGVFDYIKKEREVLREDIKTTAIEKLPDFSRLTPNTILAITGEVLEYILENSTPEFRNLVFAHCKIYGDLSHDQRTMIIKELKNTFKSEISYIFYDNADQEAVNVADISISMGDVSPLSKSIIICPNKDFSNLESIFNEGRLSSANLSQNIQFIFFFVGLQFFGFIILSLKGIMYGKYQLLFLDFCLFLGLGVLQSKQKTIINNNLIIEKRFFSFSFLSKVVFQVFTGCGIVYIVELILWKTKFYRNPSQITNSSRAASVDNAFYYDPFCIFITELFVILAFVFVSNKNSLMKRRSLKNDYMAYLWLLIFIFGIYLLGVEKIHFEIGFNEFLINKFVIPGMFGFEIIIVAFIPLTLAAMFISNLIRSKINRMIVKIYSRRQCLSHKKEDCDEIKIISLGMEKLCEKFIQPKASERLKKQKFLMRRKGKVAKKRKNLRSNTEVNCSHLKVTESKSNENPQIGNFQRRPIE